MRYIAVALRCMYHEVSLAVVLCRDNPCGPGDCEVVRGQVVCTCFQGFVLSQISRRCEGESKQWLSSALVGRQYFYFFNLFIYFKIMIHNKII